ncbi:hypothetical protein ARMSODRAFT_1019924 [Armillaria solidipes]|uniref:Uncharacterized protein n=1 Tax=Armillaria solidipes TaxID=1076256 RepID=A0A2H3BHF3_9AGAR|nr:hypothetical protein ARMSODRAFT_1019924 [Armillaria solidipes]
MAEPTDLAELAALNAYDDAYGKLANLQDNLPNPDSEGAVDAWVLNVHSLWKIVGTNWEKAGVSSQAWHGVETVLVEVLPKIHEDSITVAFTEYNELRHSKIDIYPLPIPDRLIHQKTPANRVHSQVSSSPIQPCQESVAPLANLSHQPTPALQTPKQLLPPATPPHQVSPTLVSPKLASPPTTPPQTKLSSVTPPPPKRAVSLHTSDLAMEVPKLNYSTATSPHASSSSEKSQTKLTMFLRPKPPPPPAYAAFTGLQVPAGGNNSGWGLPAWSPISLTDDTPSSPSGGYVFFPPDQTSSLHYRRGHPFKIGPPTNDTHIEKPTHPTLSPLHVVDAATCPVLLPGPDPACREGSIPSPLSSCQPLFYPGTDDEEEQSCGVMVDEEHVEESGSEGGASQGQEDDAPTPPLNNPIDVDWEPTWQSDDDSSPPPTMVHRQKHKILFMFDDTTGDFEDPHPTIFLPRHPTPQDQEPHRSTHPRASPVDPDATYLKMTQGSKSSGNKKDKKNHAESSNKKDAKGKKKELASLKRARNDDDDSQPVDMPVTKKLKSKDAKVDEAEVVHATPAFQKHGPALSKPPAMIMGISGGGIGEKIPSTVKPIKDGLKSIGVLVVEEDYGKFVKYTKPCDTCRRRGTHCRKLLTHTIICVHCHYAKQPCKVDGEVMLNPVSHYRPKGYKAINTFESALNTIEVNNAAVTSLVQQFLAGLNVLSHTESIRVQSSCLCKCLNPVEEVVVADEDSEVESVAEGVVGPLKKKKKAKSG